AQELFEYWTEIINIAKDLLVNAQEKQSDQTNKKRRYLELNEGDLVLLNLTNIILQKSAKRASKKLIAKLIGPFKIVQKISAVTYRLKLPETLRIHPVFHISLLKPYYPSEFRDEVRKEPPEIATKDLKEHEVEAILDKRTYYCHLQYLVKWKDHPLYDATWELLTNLENYKDLVKEFEKTSETVLNGES
ncbi:106_t:CDS:1, partial [Racocetra persica]